MIDNLGFEGRSLSFYTSGTAATSALARFEGDLSGMIVHQDQDSVYESNRWIDRLLEDAVRLSYSMNGARTTTWNRSTATSNSPLSP